MVIVRRVGSEYPWRCGKIFCVRLHGSKDQQPRTIGKLIVERGFLCLRFSRQHQKWPYIERLLLSRVGCFRRAREPLPILAESPPNGRKMFGFFRFQVKVKRDQRPVAVVAFAQSFFNERTNALKKIFLQSWLRASRWCTVRNDRPGFPRFRIFVPQEVLFDGKRRSSRKGPVNPIVPPLEIGVAIVRVQNAAGAGMSGAHGGLWKNGRAGKRKRDRQTSS